MRPLVSILMPCYNAEKFLRFSLESILNQDYSNLEVICVDDGSTDGTYKLLQDYSSADTRLVIIKNPTNLGLITTLNQALTHVRGEFFARMDADDYSTPDRIAKQVDFLTKHPHYDLVASGYHYFVSDHKKLEYVPPIAFLPGALKFASLFSTPFNHGSTMGRTELIKKGFYRYDKEYPHSEDYELFSRLALEGVRMANLPDALYWVRQNPESVSVVYNDIQINSHLKITKRNLSKLELGIEEPNESLLKILANRINMPVRYDDVLKTFIYLEKCLKIYMKKHELTSEELTEIKNYLTLHGLNILIQSNKMGMFQNKLNHLSFFVRSWALLKTNHVGGIISKTVNFIRYRMVRELITRGKN